MSALSRNFDGPARRIAIAGVVTVVLVAVAVGLTLWRYGAAVDSDRAALAESQVQLAAEQAREALSRKNGLVDAYAGDKDPADLGEIDQANADLATAFGKLRTASSDNAAERRQVDEMVAGSRGLDQLFKAKVVPVAGTPHFDTGVKPYAAEEAKISDAVTSYARERGAEARAGEAKASSDADSAKLVAIIAGALAALAAIVTALYSS
ncbi:MAG: hypothetical protein QOD76_399, partial [Solirubrobacteraceae bacterium]|nr:hypothetical protein [Solirubrobacteraceae bacterium]